VFRQKLVIGTRGSSLALWQTEYVSQKLRAVAPNLDIEVKRIKTQGDLLRDRPLSRVGGKGFFVKELENALLSGEADLAVHSLKDVPTELPDGLALGATLERTDPHDALVARGGGELSALPQGARVGTSSLRRRAQLLAVRPDLEVADLRGNVDTRLRKLHAGEYDALVLAAAGLARLGLEEHISQRLPLDVMLPAPAQGALAVECRAGDEALLELLRPIHHRPTWAAVSAERAFLSGLGGGCSVPVAAYAVERPQGAGGDTALRLRGLVASLDGRQVLRVVGDGPPEEPERLGQRLAQEALARGASAILEDIRESLAERPPGRRHPP
jgi:hydroxymethylbilane synthase